MKCVNCGAELTGSVCEYCGSSYDGPQRIKSILENEYTGTITIGDKTYEVYLGDMRVNVTCNTMMADDQQYHTELRHKRTFTLIEI